MSRSRLVVEGISRGGEEENMADEGTVLTPRSSHVGVCYLTLHSLFHSCEIVIQNQVILPHVANNYTYKCMIDTLCRNNKTENELSIALWV